MSSPPFSRFSGFLASHPTFATLYGGACLMGGVVGFLNLQGPTFRRLNEKSWPLCVHPDFDPTIHAILDASLWASQSLYGFVGGFLLTATAPVSLPLLYLAFGCRKGSEC